VLKRELHECLVVVQSDVGATVTNAFFNLPHPPPPKCSCHFAVGYGHADACFLNGLEVEELYLVCEFYCCERWVWVYEHTFHYVELQ